MVSHVPGRGDPTVTGRVTGGEAEIRRHHTDFEKVRTALDSYESDRWMEDKMLVKEIRNIVG